jgi:hypothetical protein
MVFRSDIAGLLDFRLSTFEVKIYAIIPKNFVILTKIFKKISRKAAKLAEIIEKKKSIFALFAS